MRNADIGWIDVTIDVEVANVPVPLLPDVIRQPAQRQQIGRAVKRDSILEAQPLSGKNFFGNRLQSLVGDCKFAHYTFDTIIRLASASFCLALPFESCLS